MQLLKNDVIVIHRPKTGGSSLRTFFADNGLVKVDYKSNNSLYKGKYSYFQNLENLAHPVPVVKEHKWISITRDPISWYRSFFYFHVQKGRQGRVMNHSTSILAKAFYAGFSNKESFETFIDYMYDRNHAAYTEAYNFYNKRCDVVFNLKNIKEELSQFLIENYGEDFDVHTTYPIVNPTQYKRDDYPTEVPQGCKDKIMELDKTFF